MNFRQLIESYQGLTLHEYLYIFFRYHLAPFSYIATFLPNHGSILDIGCGAGIFCLCIHEKQSTPRHIVGIDPDSKKLGIAQKMKVKSIIFRDTLMSDSKFDCITLIDVLYLLNKKERNRLFNQIRHLLNANGKIIINTNFYHDTAKFKLTAFLEMVFVRYLQTTHSASKNVFYTQFSAFQEEIERAGFTIEYETEKNHTLFYPHHIVVLRFKAN